MLYKICEITSANENNLPINEYIIGPGTLDSKASIKNIIPLSMKAVDLLPSN
jgi:hypothetical protein